MSTSVKDFIAKAARADSGALSEYDSKVILAVYGVPVTREQLSSSVEQAQTAARDFGYPVVMKGCGTSFAHKSELGLVRVGVEDDDAVAKTYQELEEIMQGKGQVLVQEMMSGKRELIVGAIRDAQFGPCVTVGLGGFMAEAIADTALRLAPVNMQEAREMLLSLRAATLLEGFRGLPPADMDALAEAIVGVSKAIADNPEIAEIDVNPIIIRGDAPLAVDALVVLRS